MLKFLLFALVSFSGFAQTHILNLTTDLYHNEEEVFYSHQGEGRFDTTLAMSVRYTPILKARQQIETALNKKLDYFKLWNAEGEAHITVVTPLEYFDVLKSKLSMSEIEAIADRYDIQQSRLMILGMGSGKTMIEGKEEETFFLIVDSYELRTIRQMIFYEFTRRGGDRSGFDPAWFFPHITIGYTKRDLHEADGVIKNLKHSSDKRFNLQFR